ncbi:MAG: glycerophosphodiester phosphodiesterase [Acidobacteriales bacterium]|nr:glycerophosphodiester phosphodiesterase [Terriglobales bacterium]
MPAPAHPSPLLLGHRGAKLYAPENTFAAFDLALAHGCHGFEFDVRRTGDGTAVVVHDPEVNGVAIANTTLARLREQSPLLPTLEEVWLRYHSRAFLDVELKVTGLSQEMTRLWRDFPPTKGALVSSYLPEAIQEVHALAPGVPLGYICRDPRRLDQWRRLPIEYAVLQHELLNGALISELHKSGKKVIVWTLNETPGLKRFAVAGVAAIISDDSRLLVRTIGPGTAGTSHQQAARLY